ncbi:cytochrome b561 [Devosia sp. UYZn731]|uniref:cytochrome b n=1 Tax=Devosia sp. UYZn731 TaxID=3156345 RepID=UPI0033953E70
MNDQQAVGYSTLQIALHWVIAALVAFQLFFGEGMTNVRDAAEEGTTPSGVDFAVSVGHYWFGIAILALVLVRLGVRLTQGVPPGPVASPTWMDWAARLMHWAFYAMLIAMPVLGLLTVYVSDTFGDIHKLGKPVFIVLIAVHALAAVFHQFVKRDGTLRRMLVPAR